MLFFVSILIINDIIILQCQYGGIGRRVGFKIQWPQGRVGSTPTTGTNKVKKTIQLSFFILRNIAYFLVKTLLILDGFYHNIE